MKSTVSDGRSTNSLEIGIVVLISVDANLIFDNFLKRDTRIGGIHIDHETICLCGGISANSLKFWNLVLLISVNVILVYENMVKGKYYEDEAKISWNKFRKS